jgi:hypothetical protein
MIKLIGLLLASYNPKHWSMIKYAAGVEFTYSCNAKLGPAALANKNQEKFNQILYMLITKSSGVGFALTTKYVTVLFLKENHLKNLKNLSVATLILA